MAFVAKNEDIIMEFSPPEYWRLFALQKILREVGWQDAKDPPLAMLLCLVSKTSFQSLDDRCEAVSCGLSLLLVLSLFRGFFSRLSGFPPSIENRQF